MPHFSLSYVVLVILFKKIVFSPSQHIVYLTKFVLSYVIPDVPYRVKEQIRREKHRAQVVVRCLIPVDDGTVKFAKVNLTGKEM